VPVTVSVPLPRAVVPVVRLAPGTERKESVAVPLFGPVVAPFKPATTCEVPPAERYGAGRPVSELRPPAVVPDTSSAWVTVFEVISAVLTIAVVPESDVPTR